jgi:hypothetical protein
MGDKDWPAPLILKNGEPRSRTYGPAKVHRVVPLTGHQKRLRRGHAFLGEDAGCIGEWGSGGAEMSLAETRVIAISPGRGDGDEHGMPIAVFR